MAKDRSKPRSLRAKMMAFMLICWLLPVLMVVGSMSFFVLNNYNHRVKEEIAGGLEAGLQVSADKLDSAVAMLRRTAYDGTVRDAWLQWQNGSYGWMSLYSQTSRYLSNQYRSDTRFPLVAFWFSENPETMRAGFFDELAGGSYRRLSDFWEQDYEGVAEFAQGLDTYVGIYETQGRLYLVRNLTHRFNVIGTQAIELNINEFFSGLSQVAWGQSLCVWIDGCELVLSGQEPDLEEYGVIPGQSSAVLGNTRGGGRYCYNTIEGDGYTLSAMIQVDRSMLMEEMRGYLAILLVMFLLLGPLLILYYRLYESNVTRPMRMLMGGAQQIEQGTLGYQVESEAKSREFRYVIDSFNHMSSRLSAQFEQIYREELLLRDARIMALQSQINPHFLNNTLEIINWEARIGGNARVSQMIEALSMLLDAAMDRDKRTEVYLSEELAYINAYFFIADQRFGKRLTVIKEIAPETLDCMVPRLILQPIVENALEHGSVSGSYGRVRLSTRLENNSLIIEVENDGELSESDKNRIDTLLSPDYDAAKEGGYNLGIANVNQRLSIIYDAPSGLTIEQKDGKKVVARILIVLNERDDEDENIGN